MMYLSPLSSVPVVSLGLVGSGWAVAARGRNAAAPRTRAARTPGERFIEGSVEGRWGFSGSVQPAAGLEMRRSVTKQPTGAITLRFSLKPALEHAPGGLVDLGPHLGPIEVCQADAPPLARG